MSAKTLPKRLLLGAGPSPVPERVLEALAQPTVGHLDPIFGTLMDETVELLRETFITQNTATLPLATTGSGGMDAVVSNFVTPQDRVAVVVNGTFGERLAEAASRRGAGVVRIEGELNCAVDQQRVVEAIEQGVSSVLLVHGETSTGVCQPLDEIAATCKEHETLLLVDCVTSLAGQELKIDEYGIDVAFSGTQKCLNCPPGLAPLTVSNRALKQLRSRNFQCPSWSLDLSLILQYWQPDIQGDSPTRVYHHTAPINMIYALNEALTVVQEQGLENRWQEHYVNHQRIRKALAVFGFESFAKEGDQLYPLLAITVPKNLDEASLRKALLIDHGIEISGGLGSLSGKIWRIGVMGVGGESEAQRQLVEALAKKLQADPSEALSYLE